MGESTRNAAQPQRRPAPAQSATPPPPEPPVMELFVCDRCGGPEVEIGGQVRCPRCATDAAHTDDDPERCSCKACRAYRGRVLAGSEANLLLLRLEKVLRHVMRLCDTWMEYHGVGCPCPFCARRKRKSDLRSLRRDLAGIRWAAESGEAFISSLTYDLPRVPPPAGADAPAVVQG